MMRILLIIALLTSSFCSFSQESSDSISSDPYYVSVEQMPHYPGGDAEMMKFIMHNLKCAPTIPDSLGIQTRIVVRFKVDKSGEMSDFEVIRSMGGTMDNEFIRVLKLMPRWIPGKQNGRKVNCYYTIPLHIDFRR